MIASLLGIQIKGSMDVKDLYLICVASAGTKGLPFFVHYYQTLGFNKFIFLNDSEPDDFYINLSKDKNFTIIQKKDGYENHPTWINDTLQEHVPVGSWCLVADSDEYLVYPKYEKQPVSYFIDYLEENEYDCVSTILLDVYSENPISQVVLDYKVNPINFLNWFDVKTNERRNTKFFGGVRKRVFDVMPLITKYPLFKRRENTVISAGSHDIVSQSIFYDGAALLHAKYDRSFYQKVVSAVEKKNYWNESVEYVGYLKKLEKDDNLSMWYEGSKKYSNFKSLISEGVLKSIDWDNSLRDQPKVSIVICTHGQREISGELLESIQAQTFKDFEVIIVNNNNFDLTLPSFQDLKIIIVSESKLGLSTSRNTGVHHSTGEYIYFIDDDVVLEENCLNNLVNGVEKYDTELTGGSVLLPSKFDFVKSKKVRKYLSELRYSNDIEVVLEPKYVVGANMIFKRETFLNLGGFIENLGRKGRSLMSGEEAEFMFRIQRYGGKVSYVKDAVVYHHTDVRRTRISYMLKRYFYQGVTNRFLQTLYPEYRPKYKLFENNLYDTLLNLMKILGFNLTSKDSINKEKYDHEELYDRRIKEN